MRIRLIQPPLVQPFYRQLTLPVVGAEFIAAGLEVETSDENIEAVDFSPVDLVGITCHVYNARRAFEIADQFRQRGIPVIMGGTFPTVASNQAAPHCNSVVIGELEGQTGQIVADAAAHHLKPIYQASQPPSLDHTVKPDFSLLKNDRYFRLNFPVELSRGCRFACRFCTTKQLFGHSRNRSLKDIERDLDQYDCGQVEIVDVNFLNDLAFFKKVAPILSSKPIPGWFGQTTLLDLAADPALPEILAESRCRAVFVGLETITPAGLRSINKGWSNPEIFLDVSRRFREAGVLMQAGIIIGLDTETPAVLKTTADLLEQACVQTVSITFLHYYPNTPPFRQLKEQNRLLSEDFRDYDGNHWVVQPLCIPVIDLQRELTHFLERLYGLRSIFRRAMHKGMWRYPKQFIHHLILNFAMRSYYRQMRQTWRTTDLATQRYMSRPPELTRLEKRLADKTFQFLDWLWSDPSL